LMHAAAHHLLKSLRRKREKDRAVDEP
jgi:hypothetical protein